MHDSIKKECNDVHNYITKNITGAPDTIGQLFVEERMVKKIFPDGKLLEHSKKYLKKH